MLESGNGKDPYSFEPTTGLGSADCPGDGLFIDESKYGQYKTSGQDRSFENSLEVLFNHGGADS
jgi:hypothetical protein